MGASQMVLKKWNLFTNKIKSSYNINGAIGSYIKSPTRPSAKITKTYNSHIVERYQHSLF